MGGNILYKDPASAAFFTTFDTTENPISEGGIWSRTTAGWKDVESGGGLAYADSAVVSGYDDSYSVASWSVGSDYEIEATIYLDPAYSPPDSHETELLLRVTQGATVLKAYECNLAWNGAYAQIMEWDGVQGAGYFTPIGALNNPIAPVNGDKLRARIVGSSINFWLVHNGVAALMNSATGTKHVAGQPGMAFFMRSGGTKNKYGFADYRVTPL